MRARANKSRCKFTWVLSRAHAADNSIIYVPMSVDALLALRRRFQGDQNTKPAPQGPLH